MPTLIVRHKVKDFAAWQSAFDDHAPARLAAGLANARLFTSADDPNEVVIIFDAADIEKAKAFGASPELKEAMANAGVADKPDIYFLNAVD